MAHLKSLIAVLVFIVIGSGIYYFTRSAEGSKGEATVNTPSGSDSSQLKLPVGDLKLFNGQTIKSEILKDKIVIVNFWASWCAPCVEEVPSLIELTKKNKNIIILGISGDSKDEDITAFMKSFPEFNKVPVYQLWSENKKIIDSFKVVKLPESFIFNTKGEMVKRISGTINWNTIESIEYFNNLL